MIYVVKKINWPGHPGPVWTVEGPGIHHQMIYQTMGVINPTQEQMGYLAQLLESIRSTALRHHQKNLLHLLGLETWGRDVSFTGPEKLS